MTCDQLIEHIPQMLGPEGTSTEEAFLHLAGCSRCQTEYDATVKMIRALGEFGPEVPSGSEESALYRIGAAMGTGSTDSEEAEAPSFRSSRRKGTRFVRPLARHWAAQFVAALLLGGLAGIWITQSWWEKSESPTFAVLREWKAGNRAPEAWTASSIYDAGTGPVPGTDLLKTDPEKSLWRTNVGYVRLQDELERVFKQVPDAKYYLHPELKEIRISPLKIEKGLPFPEFLQRVAHASDLISIKNQGGQSFVLRTDGAHMYKRGPIYYFVPAREDIAPIHIDLYRAIQSYF